MPRTSFCAGCGKELLPHFANCPNCALPVPQTQPETTRQQETPRNRPVATPPDYQPPYRWMDTNETPNRVTPIPTPQPYQPPPPQPPVAPANFPCPTCGRTVTHAQAFCTQCGRPVQAMQSSPYQAPMQPAYRPVTQPSAHRTSNESAIIAIIAIIAAIVILAYFC